MKSNFLSYCTFQRCKSVSQSVSQFQKFLFASRRHHDGPLQCTTNTKLKAREILSLFLPLAPLILQADSQLALFCLVRPWLIFWQITFSLPSLRNTPLAVVLVDPRVFSPLHLLQDVVYIALSFHLVSSVCKASHRYYHNYYYYFIEILIHWAHLCSRGCIRGHGWACEEMCFSFFPLHLP